MVADARPERQGRRPTQLAPRACARPPIGTNICGRAISVSLRSAGLGDSLINAIAAGATSVPAPYDIVAETIDAASALRSIPEVLQARVAERFGVPGLIEIVTLCGSYTLIAMDNVCFDSPVPNPPKS